jgi:hypothetical protein
MAPLEKESVIQNHDYLNAPNSQVKSETLSGEEEFGDSDRYETGRRSDNESEIQSFEYSNAQHGHLSDKEKLEDNYNYNYNNESTRRVSVQLPPMQMMVHGMVNHKIVGGNCKRLVTGGVLQEAVKCIIVSTEWFHNLGFEGASRLILTLYDDQKKVQKRADVFGGPPKRGFAAYRYFSQYDEIVALARPGFHYQLEIKVAKGQKDAITLNGLICKIIPSSTIGQSFNFSDQEGTEGRYRGDVDFKGRPHGKGVIDYQNGGTFVGKFIKGEWKRGVKYFGTDVIGSMKEGRWDSQIDVSMATEFDYDVHFFVKEKKSKEASERTEEVEEAPQMLSWLELGCCL